MGNKTFLTFTLSVHRGQPEMNTAPVRRATAKYDFVILLGCVCAWV